MIYILFVFLTLREKIDFVSWQSKNTEAQKDMDMLVLDSLSATIVALTMPAFLFGFIAYGHLMIKTLGGLFKD